MFVKQLDIGDFRVRNLGSKAQIEGGFWLTDGSNVSSSGTLGYVLILGRNRFSGLSSGAGQIEGLY